MTPFETPARYRTTDAENALLTIDERLLKFSTKWGGSSGALLIGPTRCGKSLSAAAAMRRLTLDKPRYWATWVRSDTVTSIGQNRKDREADLCRIKSAYILTLDELGYERWPELVLEIIGERYDRDLPTVVTSGLKIDELRARYGDATVRKIIEIGNGLVIDCWSNSKTELSFAPIPELIQRNQMGCAWDGMDTIDVSNDPRFA